MVYRIVSATAQPGKMQEARQLFLDVAAYVTEKYGHKVDILSNISGPSNRLHFIGQHESLGAVGKVLTHYKADSKFQEFMTKVPDVLENDREFNLFRVES